jgi:DNA-binding NarL/FixJ family response regulator
MDIFNEENPLRIILADDHEVVRAGLRRILSIDKSIKIMGEASNGAEAVELVKYHKPDVALLDILMPVQSGIEATEAIRKLVPETLILMLTAFEDSQHVELAVAAGADGYLTKDIDAKELVRSIHRLIKGERVFSKNIINIIQKKYIPDYDTTPEAIVITKREQQVLNLVAVGKTSAEIADELNVSIRTVESHRYNLMQKLGVKNTAGLVRYAVLKST